MRFSPRLILVSALAFGVLAGGAVVAQDALTQNPAEVRAGAYELDASHGRITWAVNHMGFSTYRGQFTEVSAQLTLDPANPSASTLTASVPMASVAPNDDALKAHLLTADFFDAERYPTAEFRSTAVVVDAADPTRAQVTGDLTLHGVTKPVTLAVKFNQAGPSNASYRAGFDAETVIRRSEFGINTYVPALGDDVHLHIEGEFVTAAAAQ